VISTLHWEVTWGAGLVRCRVGGTFISVWNEDVETFRYLFSYDILCMNICFMVWFSVIVEYVDWLHPEQFVNTCRIDWSGMC
jgi:hypothetical protein